ncbi:MAG: hypothetical protein HOK52_07405 [Candidatus Marinimicrobia bacterium]|jgi:hypothetical protein|nr:hypothetical protein [Candidatus Woesearchaeota archaeon]MBT6471069.1 hypothetical protein [Candidatus Neomarinimicrobiota bacterium]
MKDENKCSECGVNPKTEPHICPYKDDIDGDDETLCTCCEYCSEQCAADI